MLFSFRKRWLLSIFGLGVLVLLFLFRYELLLKFQLHRLGKLGCTSVALAPAESSEVIGGCRKFWAHRVDSYERFKKLRIRFAGLETDVVFNSATKKFVINHPPGRSTGLLLDKFLSESHGSITKLWIDVKNISGSEVRGAVTAFEELDRFYGIKKRVIIESSSAELVNALASYGFEVSFLVPSPTLKEITPLSPAVKFVSQEDTYIDKLKELYPGKKILTWALSFNNYFDLAHLKSLMSDTSIFVVLINVKSKNYR
jgi:hypothetical protein